MTILSSVGAASQVDPSHIAAVQARYRRASDAELQELAAAGRENFTPWAWQLLEEAMAQRTAPARAASVQESAGETGNVRAVVEPSDNETRESGAVVESSGIPYPKAPLGLRCRALAIDSLIAAAGYIPTFVWFAVTDETTASTIVLRLLFFAGVGWALYYSFAKDGHAAGQSIRKKQVGLMVVNLATDQPCSRIESGGRTIVMIVLGAIPFFGFLIEPIVALAANDGRRLGDRLAGTQVIAAEDYARANRILPTVQRSER